MRQTTMESSPLINGNLFLDAMRFRFACKKFDPTKHIDPQVFETIVESGRLTPSSFGMEPTRLLILQDPLTRQKLQPHCWNQAQITQASHIVIYLVKIADMHHTSNYAQWAFERKLGKDPAQIHAYKNERYGGFLATNGYTDSKSIFAWCARQAYLVASTMIDCAAFMGVDSCAIEGFEKKNVEEFLDLDPFAMQVALIVAFGYRLESPAKSAPRLLSEEFAHYI